jgi:hypothetical protein
VCVRVCVRACVRAVCVYTEPHLDGYDAEAPLILRRCQHANGTCHLRQVRERYGVQGVEGVSEPGSAFSLCCIFVVSFLMSQLFFLLNTNGVQIGERLARSLFMCVCVCSVLVFTDSFT